MAVANCCLLPLMPLLVWYLAGNMKWYWKVLLAVGSFTVIATLVANNESIPFLPSSTSAWTIFGLGAFSFVKKTFEGISRKSFFTTLTAVLVPFVGFQTGLVNFSGPNIPADNPVYNFTRGMGYTDSDWWPTLNEAFDDLWDEMVTGFWDQVDIEIPDFWETSSAEQPRPTEEVLTLSSCTAVVVTENRANALIRAQPNMNSDAIGHAPYGVIVTTLMNESPDWTQVQYDGKTGWIYSSLLIEQPCSN